MTATDHGLALDVQPAGQQATRPASELSIKAAALWLPSGKQGPADGELSAADIERIGMTELYAAPDDVAPPEMAVIAAGDALARSGIDPAAVGCLIHSFSYHQGHDMWSPAHYIAHQAGISSALPVNVQQLCNGGAVALQLAGKWLSATPDAHAALVTTADRFCLPGFRRWTSDDDAVYSDSATAVVLGRTGGDGDLLHLLALEMMTDADWETQMRGEDAFSPVPLGHRTPIDLRHANKVFRESGAAARMVKITLPKLYELVHRTLGKSGIEATDISCVAISRLTRQMREHVFMPAISEFLGGSPRFLESGTGCLGAGDFLANLVDIQGSLRPGEFGLLFQGTGGLTFTCAVVQAPADSTRLDG